MRALSLFFVLFSFWLLLSGIYKPFLVVAGFSIAALSVVFARRMDVVDHEGHPIGHAIGVIFTYWPWLIKEITLSALKVSSIIINPRLPIDPKMAVVKLTQKTDLGRTIFANSITLTPGTIAVEMYDDSVLVHSIHKDGIKELEDGNMDRKVTAVE